MRLGTFQCLGDAKMKIQHRKLRKNSQKGKRRTERKVRSQVTERQVFEEGRYEPRKMLLFVLVK